MDQENDSLAVNARRLTGSEVGSLLEERVTLLLSLVGEVASLVRDVVASLLSLLGGVVGKVRSVLLDVVGGLVGTGDLRHCC